MSSPEPGGRRLPTWALVLIAVLLLIGTCVVVVTAGRVFTSG